MNLDVILSCPEGEKRDYGTGADRRRSQRRRTAQILSDVLGVRLHRLDHVETATSIAAAVIAGVGVGVFKDFSVIHQFVKKEDDFCPDGGNSQVYKRQKKLFEQGYRCLKEYYRLDSSL